MAKFYYGGQAVMEGVMMRGRASAAVAIRKPDQRIYLYEEALNPRLYQNRLFRFPFLRGLLLLWEMLVLGTRLMTMSANIATGAVDPDASVTLDNTQPAADGHQAVDRQAASPSDNMVPPQIGGVTMVITLVISLGFAILIFFLAPLFLASLFHSPVGDGTILSPYRVEQLIPAEDDALPAHHVLEQPELGSGQAERRSVQFGAAAPAVKLDRP